MLGENHFGNNLTQYYSFSGSSKVSPFTSGYEKQVRHPPLKEYHRSKRPLPLPRTQKIVGRLDIKYPA